MRISADQDDKGWANYQPISHKDVKVFCDDKLIKYCYTADEELGYIKAYVLNDEDHLSRYKGNSQFYELEGKVRIEVGE